MKNKFMHLTNFSINKHNKKFVYNKNQDEDGVGSKWSIQALKRYFRSRGINDTPIWAAIDDLIIKTVISIDEKTNTKLQSYNINR